MSKTVSHTVTQLLQFAVHDGELSQSVLLIDVAPPLTAQAAAEQAAAAELEVERLTRRLGPNPDRFTQQPLMIQLHRAETVRARAHFLAGALNESGQVAA